MENCSVYFLDMLKNHQDKCRIFLQSGIRLENIHILDFDDLSILIKPSYTDDKPMLIFRSAIASIVQLDD